MLFTYDVVCYSQRLILIKINTFKKKIENCACACAHEKEKFVFIYFPMKLRIVFGGFFILYYIHSAHKELLRIYIK